MSRISPAQRITAAVALVGGVAVGDAMWQGAVQHRSVQPPTGWSIDPGHTPYQLAEIGGDLSGHPDRWMLGYYRAIRPIAPHAREAPTPLAGTLTLPEDASIEVWLTAPEDFNRGGGVGLLLDRIGTPTARVFRQTPGGLDALECDAPLRLPDGERMDFVVEPARGGIHARVGDSETTCRADVRAGGAALRPGLRRVQIENLQLGEAQVPSPGPGWRPLWWLAGALMALGVVGLELWLASRAVLVALTTLPLLLAAPLGSVDFRVWAETARVTWLPVAWFGAILPLSLSVFGKLTHLLGRAMREDPAAPRKDWPLAGPIAAAIPISAAYATEPGPLNAVVAGLCALLICLCIGLLTPYLLRFMGGREPHRAATLLIGVGTVFATILSLAGTLHRGAVVGAALATTGWSLWVWSQANASRVRAYNLLSLASCLLMLCGLEGMVRGTRPGMQWSATGTLTEADDIYGWVQRATEDFAIMDGGEHRDYPDRGFPAAYERSGPRQRLVAMGGSTTGGAFQNDDLRDFYPARLEEHLRGEVEAVNQGVGGWTTFHIERYLSDHIDSLDPDILTLYVGHNDLLTPVPVPLADLYAARTSSPTLRSASERLRGVLLYQGFRYLLTSLRPAGRRVAVPVTDAHKNITQVIELVRAKQGHVVLMSEGLAPDPTPLAEYNRMLESIAAEHADVSYLDVAGALHSRHSSRFFLDDCHLTNTGHRFVAELLSRHLNAEGVLNDAP